MQARCRYLLAWLPAVTMLACGTPAPSSSSSTVSSSPSTVVVFAAASLREVATDYARALESRENVEVSFNFAGSNTLAQQIEAAPGADVFISANNDWMDVLERAGRTVPGSRRDILGNRLVLIAQRDAETEVRSAADLADGEYRFLALADPEAVPAGRYARAHLERLTIDDASLWSRIADRIAPTLDVRAALALVESDPEILGIVYHTDAATSDAVRVLEELPPLEDVPITYCAALLEGGGNLDLGRRFLDFSSSPAANEIARRHGFLPIDG